MLLLLIIGGLAGGGYLVYNHVTVAGLKTDVAAIKAKVGKVV